MRVSREGRNDTAEAGRSHREVGARDADSAPVIRRAPHRQFSENSLSVVLYALSSRYVMCVLALLVVSNDAFPTPSVWRVCKTIKLHARQRALGVRVLAATDTRREARARAASGGTSPAPAHARQGRVAAHLLGSTSAEETHPAKLALSWRGEPGRVRSRNASKLEGVRALASRNEIVRARVPR